MVRRDGKAQEEARCGDHTHSDVVDRALQVCVAHARGSDGGYYVSDFDSAVTAHNSGVPALECVEIARAISPAPADAAAWDAAWLGMVSCRLERQVKQDAADMSSSRATISVVKLVVKESLGENVVLLHADATPTELDLLVRAGVPSFAMALGSLR